jgi:FkbM family methyltransferase
MLGLIKNLSYRSPVGWAIRAFGLQHVARNWYWRVARPNGGVLPVEVRGTTAQFFARNTDELRTVEKEVLGERHALELLLSFLGPGDVVYEVGAGVGVVTVFLARSGAKVFAFEPMRGNYERLAENLGLNRIGEVQVFRVALGEWDGKAILYGGHKGVDFSASLLPSASNRMRQELVKVVEGDHFRKTQGLPLARAVHMDVEGYEYAAIRGLRETLKHAHCGLLALEIHPGLLPSEITSEHVVSLLKSLGFVTIDSYVSYSAHLLIARKAKVASFSTQQ